MLEKWNQKKEMEMGERDGKSKIQKNDIEEKEKINKKIFPEKFDEAVKNALFMGLDEWLIVKDRLEDRDQINKWYEIWRQFYKIKQR